MRVQKTEDCLVFRDGPDFVWWIGVACFLGGLALAVWPWLTAPATELNWLTIESVTTASIGVLICLAAIGVILWHPFLTTRFDRTAKTLTIRRWLFWHIVIAEVPFSSVQAIEIAQRSFPVGPTRFRLLVATRDGEHRVISGWSADSDKVHELVHRFSYWIRAGVDGKESRRASG